MTVAIREIVAMVALNFGFTPVQLLADTRKAEVVKARQIAIYIARRHTTHSSPAIGAVFNKDHTSILHATDRIDADIRAEPHGRTAALVNSIVRNIDFRNRIEALGSVDVLAVARRIAAHPVHRAIGASVMEIAALAATVVDLWEIALAAEEMAALQERADVIRGIDGPLVEESDRQELAEIDSRMNALGDAILDEMAGIRAGDTNADKQETEDGSNAG